MNRPDALAAGILFTCAVATTFSLFGFCVGFWVAQ
jgi:hypothetical protein